VHRPRSGANGRRRSLVGRVFIDPIRAGSCAIRYCFGGIFETAGQFSFAFAM
jgi:hypothetical protein